MTKTNKVNQKYTLDSFVVKPSNELAHTAIQKVFNRPGRFLNPLFIYGKTKSGKTHLARALMNEAILKGKKVLYITEDDLASEYIKASQSKKLDSLIKIYLENDIFILDDLHSLKGEKTQEELTNLLKEFYVQDRQIIILSDKELKYFSIIDEFIQHIPSGFVVDM